MNTQIIGGYKAFNHDLTCRNSQYEVGTTYKIEGDIELGERGFHFCPNPFDVLDCYPIIDDNGNMRRFARVSCPASKAISRDKTTVTSELTVVEELMFDDLAMEQIRQNPTTSSDCTQVAASYYDEYVAVSGDCTQVAASDYDGQVAVSGVRAKVVATGKNSVIAISGRNGCFKGVNGTFVSCADFDGNGKCNRFVTGCIGQNGLKENTWYTVRNGKFVECEVQSC